MRRGSLSPYPMAVSANVLRVSTTLRLGERVLVRCDDGLLATEYLLFDATDIVLRATDPVTVRETGYITTARDALARLAKAGVTPQLASAAARALAPEVAFSFARGGAALMTAAWAAGLGGCELFDGAVYRASSQTYEGAWLDLRGLAAALGRRGASAVLQAMHLAAALDEVARTTPLHLATANATRDRRPGERTHRRVILEGVEGMADALRRLEPSSRPADVDAQRSRLVRDALLARVRERASADAGPDLRAHLARLESALSSTEGHAPGPLSDPELRSIEQQLAAGTATGVRERLDALERSRGTSAGIRYLRARAALVGGDEPPSSVAQALSVIANEDRSFHEAELVAARAWLAAGEEAYARHFARRLAEDVTARDSERLIALEILEATSATTRSQAPPPVAPGVGPAGGAPRVAPPAPGPPVQIAPAIPAAPAVPAMPPVPGVPVVPVVPVVPAHASFAVPAADGPARSTEASAAAVDGLPARVPRGASLPPTATVRPPSTDAPAVAPRGPSLSARYEPELVESLALPLGATEEVLAVGDWPTTPIQARTAMTRLARSLARDYRLWYGSTLRCNVLAVDAMQRHLAQRYAGATLDDPKTVLELQRHGALLSEILARCLGADWADIAPTEPGYWAMFVPPTTRCWPIGRVYRYVSLGHRERDLVSYFLEIEARARP